MPWECFITWLHWYLKNLTHNAKYMLLMGETVLGYELVWALFCLFVVQTTFEVKLSPTFPKFLSFLNLWGRTSIFYLLGSFIYFIGGLGGTRNAKTLTNKTKTMIFVLVKQLFAIWCLIYMNAVDLYFSMYMLQIIINSVFFSIESNTNYSKYGLIHKVNILHYQKQF